MHSSFSIVFTALVAASSVAAHGKIVQLSGDAGGNGTALGIMGGVVPGPGRNSVTETDTTVFKGKAADSCGKTKANGVNDIATGMKSAMALSGDMLPQVTPGGKVMGTVHIVTSDGFGPYTVMVDPTGTGDFSNAQPLPVDTQVPGRNGNGKKTVTQRAAYLLRRAGIMARATNINEDFPIQASLPKDLQCTGSMNGMDNICAVKFVNPSAAGPFGGCVMVQMAGAGAAAPAPAAAARKFRKARM